MNTSQRLRDAFDRMDHVFSKRPTMALVTTVARVRVVSGVHCEAVKDDWRFAMDLPVNSGGTNAAQRRLWATAAKISQSHRRRAAVHRPAPGNARSTSFDPATKPKHLRTFHSVASAQKAGDVVAQQSSSSTHA